MRGGVGYARIDCAASGDFPGRKHSRPQTNDSTGRRSRRRDDHHLERFKVCTNYETMFSDTRPRNRLVMRSPIKKSRSPVQSNRKTHMKSVEDVKTMMKVEGSHRTLFYRQPSRKHTSSYTTVVVSLEPETVCSRKKVVTFQGQPDADLSKTEMVITLPIKSAKMVTKGVQTDYRESEAQTLPWRHEIRAERKLLDKFLALESFYFNTGRGFLPGMQDVGLIEVARQKLAWENVLLRLKGRENDSKRRIIVNEIAAAEAAAKEKLTEAVHEERLSLSAKQIRQEREIWEEKLAEKVRRSYRMKRQKNDEELDWWNNQLLRKLRKMKYERMRSAESAKSDFITVYREKTARLHDLPGGHEVIDIQCRYLKRFHGLKILEKHLSTFTDPKSLGFDYAEASKPKKTVKMCPRRCREEARTEEVLDAAAPAMSDDGNSEKPFSFKIRVGNVSRTPKTDTQDTETEEDRETN